MRCEEEFKKLYDRAPVDVAYCPYRICPLGAHVDHQLGKINGFAIDKGIHIAYGPQKNGVIEMKSLNFAKRAQFHVNQVEDEKVGDWADHLRGATKMLGEKYSLSVGMCGIIEGSLPIGGLSSSAAVIIAFITALCKLNNIKLTQIELIMLAQKAENEYVGVSCGKLDQSCEVFSRKNHLLYLDTLTGDFELIPSSSETKPYVFGIFFSGLERSLKNSGYNLRVDECKAASYALKAFADIEYGNYSDSYLREVPYEIYLEHKDKLPEIWRRRAEHFYSESLRVVKGVDSWKQGKIEQYGELVFESGYSSVHNYECGCPELIELYDILTETKGIYGGRFSGAGFKGCCMAILDPYYAEDIEALVKKEYLKKFPELDGKYSFHLCNSAGGVSFD